MTVNEMNEKIRNYCRSFSDCDDCKLYPVLPRDNGFIVSDCFKDIFNGDTFTDENIIRNYTAIFGDVKKDSPKEETKTVDKSPVKKEMVNHPTHYQGNKFEVIDIIEDYKLDFCLGNAIKYILRAGKKDDIIQDINKAIWYLERFKESKNG